MTVPPAVRVAPASPRAPRPCWPPSPTRCGSSPWSPGARRRAVTSWRWPCQRPGSSPRWPP
jgi:hypothetical protein